MPGLIDAHVHAGNIEIRNHLTVQLAPAVYVLKTCRNLESDIDLGFTTLRDAAGLDPSFRAAVDQGLVRGPRLALSITPLVQSGGSTPMYGLGPDKPLARNALEVYPEVCDGPDQVRAAARRALGRGADQIKLFADGEVLAAQAADRAKPGQWKFEHRRASGRRGGCRGGRDLRDGSRVRAESHPECRGRRCPVHRAWQSLGRRDGEAHGREGGLLRADADHL